MEFRNRRRPWLAGIAIGVLFALLIAPATSWIVRTQLSFVIPVRPSTLPFAYLELGQGVSEDTHKRAMELTRDYARSHPNDLPLQIAAAVDKRDFFNPASDGTQHSGAAALRSLVERFPNSASLYANILRHSTLREVAGCKREEEFLLQNNKPDINLSLRSTPENLETFDRDAAEGERLEPDNAYFPMMRAMELFAAHKDEEALAALDRAAHCSIWAEHYEDEVNGRSRLMDEALGDHSALGRTAIAYMLLFPQYAAVRGVARVAAYKAMELEMSGHVQEGYAIRHNLLLVGSKMRVHARSLIGCMVGIAISRHAYMRLEGAPPLKTPDKLPRGESERIASTQLDVFCAYLHKIGHKEDERWARAEHESARFVRSSVFPYPDQIDQTRLLVQLGVSWVSGMAMLCNSVWILILGGACALLIRNRNVRAGLPMASGVRSGSVLGFAARSGVAASALINPGTALAIISLTVGVNLILLVVRARSGSKELRRGLAAFWIGEAVVIPATLFTLCHSWSSAPANEIWASLLGINAGAAQGGSEIGVIRTLAWLAWSLPLVPILVATGIGIVSIACRVPLSVGLVRGFRGLAVPVSCILCLIYAGIIVRTVRQEAYSNYTIQRFVEHEGRFVAEVRGKPWPGETTP